jgi:oligopeptide transport system ATP-binding protein
VVAGTCDRILVMYAGSIVESAPRREIFYSPRHPYTIGLLKSVPRLDQPRGERLPQIDGAPPDLARIPSGCPFHTRCPFATQYCRDVVPELRSVDEGHMVACHYDIGKEQVA